MNNPKECFNMVEKSTFFILNQLTPAEGTDNNPPLALHHDTFSRFVFGIINESKTPATANLKVEEVPGILRKARALEERDYLASLRPVRQEPAQGLSPAYTVVMTMGKFKGKTPAQVLLENPNDRQSLINQGGFLQQNIQKYPRNKQQLDAIKDAIALFDTKKLEKKESQTSSDGTAATVPVPIYTCGMRPLTRRKRDDGKCFVYDLAFIWNGGTKRPFQVKITNFWAPVVKLDNGLLNVMAKQKSDEVVNSFFLTEDDFDWMAHILEANIRTFEDLNAKRAYSTAIREAVDNKNKWRASIGGAA